MPERQAEDADAIRHEFGEAVNMTAGELERWLATEESQAVGQKDGGSGESTGHESGRRIVALLHTRKADLTDDDLAHMRKVTGYVRRHLAQRPAKEDVETSKWRYSLMNWGHDPVKE
ncbi:DNA-binding protein [Modestobacter sp. VKM Ac-2676]|nr:DNA-binding protein [Modestobacter sp. VKM Ac-2676]